MKKFTVEVQGGTRLIDAESSEFNDHGIVFSVGSDLVAFFPHGSFKQVSLLEKP